MTQLLKTAISPELLQTFLQLYAEKYELIDHRFYYKINKAVLKKALFHNAIVPFYACLKPSYHMSKQYYLERAITYGSFTTVLRQVCKANNVRYETEIIYDKSAYETEYHIYI
jgi:hypothetical protein